MSTPFIAIKKALGLYDIIDFGKYKGCRVDSIVDQDPSYLNYARIHFDTRLDHDVISKIDQIALARTTSSEVKAKRYREGYKWFSDNDDSSDDVPDYFDPKPVYYADGSGYMPASGPSGALYFDRDGNT